MRTSGSTINMRRIRYSTLKLKCCGICNYPDQIFCYNSFSFLPLKGSFPLSIMNNKIPRDQTSVGGPECSFLSNISGAMKHGVPQNSFHRLSFGRNVLNPKSTSLVTPASFMSIFSGFISRWVINLLWKWATA